MQTFIIDAILALFAGASLFAGYGYVIQGRKQSSLDDGNSKLNTNALLKEQIDALETKVDMQSNEIKALTEKVKTLTASLDDERKKFTEAILAIQGKDPQMTEFVATMKTYIEMSRPLLDEVNKKVIPTVERLGRYLDSQKY